MWLEHLVQDLRYAWRGLRRSPAFLATTVLTLAVGLGLVTVAFSVFNAYVLRPYAVRDPDRLHRIAWTAPDGGGQRFRWRDYVAVRSARICSRRSSPNTRGSSRRRAGRSQRPWCLKTISTSSLRS